MLESIVGLCRESRKRTLSRTGFERPYVTHGRIVEAIARQDPDGAARAMREHLEITRDDLAKDLGDSDNTGQEDQPS